MEIKKLQVIMAFLFGLLALIVTIIRQISNSIVTSLAHDSQDKPLERFPADQLQTVNLLRSMICVITVTIYAIISFLLYQIGVK